MNLRLIMLHLVSDNINQCIHYLKLWRDVLNDDVSFQPPLKLDTLVHKDGIKLFWLYRSVKPN